MAVRSSGGAAARDGVPLDDSVSPEHCAIFQYLNTPELIYHLLHRVTVVFVIGYSWVDTHLLVLANQGSGVDVAWRRA